MVVMVLPRILTELLSQPYLKWGYSISTYKGSDASLAFNARNY